MPLNRRTLVVTKSTKTTTKKERDINYKCDYITAYLPGLNCFHEI